MDVAVAATLILLTLYHLVKDVVVPLVKKVTKKQDKHVPETCPYAIEAAQKAVEPIAAKIPVLEFNLKTHETRLVEFGDLIREHAAQNERTAVALDNKLDIVLQELKEFREAIIDRVSRVETHIEHLLKGGTRRGAGND